MNERLGEDFKHIQTLYIQNQDGITLVLLFKTSVEGAVVCWLMHQVLLSLTFRWRTSCRPSAHRLVAPSCFSIDLFALKPSFTKCDQPRLQLQTP